MRFNPLFLVTLLGCSAILGASDSVSIVHIHAANEFLARHEFGHAINELLPVVRSAKRLGAADQTVGVALTNLGYSYRMLGRCQDAIEVLTQAQGILNRTALQPGFIATNGINLLASYLECGEGSRAVTYWFRTLAPLAIKPGVNSAPLWTAGATALMTRKRYAESEMLFTQAIAILEREPEKNLERLVVARSSRGVSRAYLGRMDEAQADALHSESLLSLTGLPPSVRAIVFNNIGLTYLMSGFFDQAGKDLGRALASLEESPGCQCGPNILANYARLLRATGRVQAAKETQRQAAELARRLGSQSSGPTVDVSAFGTFGEGPAR